MRTGIAFRAELAPWLTTRPREIRCLELTVGDALAEAPTARVARARPWPVVLHAPELSLGTSAPLDPAELDRVVRAVRAVDPVWVAAYLGCRHRPEVEASYPQPVSLQRTTLGRVVANCRELSDACARPVLVENVAAFGGADGPFSHAEFLNRLCAESGCGLLVDVAALTVDARLGFDPRRWLWDVEPFHVVALHLGSWTRYGPGRWARRYDAAESEEAWMLARELVDRTPAGTAILRRDAHSQQIPGLQAELRLLASLDRAAVPSLGWPERAVAVSS
jgi:uncharacterized protein (UPF0276 family)